jgi:hypothetical protein
VHYSARRLLWEIAILFGPAVYGAITSGRFALAGSCGLLAFIVGQSWRVVRRRVAYGVGTAGVYLGATVYKPKLPAELIPWTDITGVDICVRSRSSGRDDVQKLIVSTRKGRPPARERKVEGWILDPEELSEAVLRFGARVVGRREEPTTAPILTRVWRRISGKPL